MLCDPTAGAAQARRHTALRVDCYRVVLWTIPLRTLPLATDLLHREPRLPTRGCSGNRSRPRTSTPLAPLPCDNAARWHQSAPARTQAPRRHQHAVPDLGRHHRRARGLPPLIPHGSTGMPSPDAPAESTQPHVATQGARSSSRPTRRLHGPNILGPGGNRCRLAQAPTSTDPSPAGPPVPVSPSEAAGAAPASTGFRRPDAAEDPEGRPRPPFGRTTPPSPAPRS